jgi:hypothetical protein
MNPEENHDNNRENFMIRSHVWCLLGVLSLAAAASSHAQQSSVGTEKTIDTLENQWLQAQRTNNPDLVSPILAEKFVYTDGEGKLDTKAAMLADAKVDLRDPTSAQSLS